MPDGQSFRDVLSPRQVERFWRSVDQTPGACWAWRGGIVKGGYGRFVARSAAWKPDGHRAHRVAWELLRGPVPAGLQLDHVCRNRLCVNPDHLEIVTNKVNVLRGVSPAAINARRTHCRNGHAFSVANTRIGRGGGKRICRACSRIRAAIRYARKRLEAHS